MKSYLLSLLLTMAWACYGQIGSKIKAASGELEGQWVNNDFGYAMTLSIYPGGKGEFDGESMSYTKSGNELTMTWAEASETYRCNLSGNQLTLSGGDLDSPITFIREGGNAPAAVTVPSSGTTGNELIGTWTGSGEVLNFKDNTTVIYNGYPLPYTLSANTVTLQTSNGNVSFQYVLSGNQLTLSTNGQTFIYAKGGADAAAPGSNGSSSKGTIAAEMVGKWCYVNVTSTNTGGWSSDECFTLHEDGTYEYYGESSGSASGYDSYGNQTFAGGTAGSTSDRGTWRVQGNSLIANSQTQGQITYSFQKQNHPKNGDPMLVINGRAYVTYYQKAPWR